MPDTQARINPAKIELVVANDNLKIIGYFSK